MTALKLASVIHEEFVLHLADVGEPDLSGIRRAVILHLREIERHFGHVPRFAPASGQRFHLSGVDATMAGVRFTLAPNRSETSVSYNRCDLAVEYLREVPAMPGRPAHYSGSCRKCNIPLQDPVITEQRAEFNCLSRFWPQAGSQQPRQLVPRTAVLP